MEKYKKGNDCFPCDKLDYDIIGLLRLVDRGDARLKATYDMSERLQVNIYPDGSDYFFSDRYDMTWEQFNALYGKEYITAYNFYL